MEKIKRKIVELIGKFDDPFDEYYSHMSQDMWKWLYPFPRFTKDKIVLCEV